MHGEPAHRYSGQGLLTPSQEWPILRTGTHGQVPGPLGHPADNYESTCPGQGSGNSGLCAYQAERGGVVNRPGRPVPLYGILVIPRSRAAISLYQVLSPSR